MSSGVEFDEDKFSKSPSQMYAQQRQSQGGSKMADWLIRRGIAKSPAAAQGIMLGVVIVNLVLAFLIYKLLS